MFLIPVYITDVRSLFNDCIVNYWRSIDSCNFMARMMPSAKPSQITNREIASLEK